MRHIYQRFESDCYPTCIAMVAGLSHKKALDIVHPQHMRGRDYATSDERAILTLRNLGFNVRDKRTTSINSFSDIKNLAIVAVHFKCEEFAHVVVWDPVKQKILDPYKGYRTLPKSLYLSSIEYVLELTRRSQS